MDEYLKKIGIEFSKASLEQVKKLSDNVIDKFNSTMKSITSDLTSGITQAFSNAIDDIRDMLEYSQLSSSRTRELAFGYGFSSSEAFGYEKALQAVGLESEEDLFYANTQELQQFREAFDKYSKQYSQLYDSGFFKEMQQYQYEMQDFKNEMSLEVVRFFMDNKEEIKSGMKALMQIAEWIVKGFSWLIDFLGGGSSPGVDSDLVSKYSTVTNSSTNVNVNNTFNGVSKGDETWLANAGEASYEQIIRALGGQV